MYRIVAGVILLAGLPFILISLPWMLARFKEFFSFENEFVMDAASLRRWSNGEIDVYYEHIDRDYQRYNHDEEGIKARLISLLAVNGVILALMAAFIINVMDVPLILYTSTAAMIFLFVSVLFIIWGLHPVEREEVSIFSHQEDYQWNQRDRYVLKRKILEDLLFSLASLRRVYIRKVRRLWGALFSFTTAIIVMMCIFCMLLFA